MTWIHVYPKNDTRPHQMDKVPTTDPKDRLCGCEYRLDWYSNLVIHQPTDPKAAVGIEVA